KVLHEKSHETFCTPPPRRQFPHNRTSLQSVTPHPSRALQHANPVLDHRRIGHLPIAVRIGFHSSNAVLLTRRRIGEERPPLNRGLQLFHFRGPPRSW